MKNVNIGAVEAFNDGKLRALVKTNKEQIVIIPLHVQDKVEFYGIESICPHSGGPLHLGDIEDIQLTENSSQDVSDKIRITCPWHEYKFDILSGNCEEHNLKADTWKVFEKCDSVFLEIDADSELKGVHFFQPKSNTIFECENLQKLNVNSQESMNTLSDWAKLILNTPDAMEKVKLTMEASNLWFKNKISEVGVASMVPERPLRSKSLKFVEPIKTKKWKSGASEISRITILHSLANVEQWAIDLAWDVIARFSDYKTNSNSKSDDSLCDDIQNNGFMPREFFDDFVKVAFEEATHFGYLCEQLEHYGSHFGALPIHDGLWESASNTSHDLLARLAIVHMVHEARGLDVNPKTIEKFRSNNDVVSAEKLEKIHQDEIGNN